MVPDDVSSAAAADGLRSPTTSSGPSSAGLKPAASAPTISVITISKSLSMRMPAPHCTSRVKEYEDNLSGAGNTHRLGRLNLPGDVAPIGSMFFIRRFTWSHSPLRALL